jgi:Glutamate-cysteine ligase family 2(GCS2)
MLRMGIEHEFVFADRAGRYLDADNSRYSTFSGIVDNFPAFAGDDAVFDCKSLEQYPKRCYVEGFERHDREGRRLETLPKGLEIRTLPHAGVDGVIAEFRSSYAEAMRLAARSGLSPVLTSRHPFKDSLALDRRFGAEESRVRTPAQLALATRAMVTHGTHVNVSLGEVPTARMLALVEKVNYYTPALIPWSFSSPFCQGRAFEGLCSRNYFRAHGRRMADLHLRHGVHVLEFRGFDACGDARLLTAVLSLFCGFLLDESLPGKAPQQDPERLKLSSLRGFDDPALRQEGQAVLRAARAAADGRGESFDLLETMLMENDSYAARMKSRYAETGCIMDCISGQYSY